MSKSAHKEPSIFSLFTLTARRFRENYRLLFVIKLKDMVRKKIQTGLSLLYNQGLSMLLRVLRLGWVEGPDRC